ncbi:Uncharacterised protein [Burkholderia pseudomallei]|nr:Uncharacterised protein [Burkholderia pseudomallei]CAJ3866158.1 Uncharacterised protein [Burkholderia pseudomallei]CAJ3896063.1 Uncharacterised protein [Burkholderia pseudomallei]CAJ5632769.1 Uncharacterised protein [Burkholderia pseudomallei]CAJ7001811.1 Uncharacterised protein [Burkholderia pseudomallei]
MYSYQYCELREYFSSGEVGLGHGGKASGRRYGR